MYLFLYLSSSDSSVQGEKNHLNNFGFLHPSQEKETFWLYTFWPEFWEKRNWRMRSTKSSQTPTFITFWNSHGLFWKEAFIMWCSSCATYLDIVNILALHLFTWALCKTRKRNWRMRFKCVCTTHDFSWVILERRFHLWWSSCVTYFDILPFCEPFSCVLGKFQCLPI